MNYLKHIPALLVLLAAGEAVEQAGVGDAARSRRHLKTRNLQSLEIFVVCVKRSWEYVSRDLVCISLLYV